MIKFHAASVKTIFICTPSGADCATKTTVLKTYMNAVKEDTS